MCRGDFSQPSPETLLVRARDAKHVEERGKKKKKKKKTGQISLTGKKQKSPEIPNKNKMVEKLSESQDEMVGKVVCLYEDSL